ncbi:peroxiredoxin-like family protein [Saccharothrix variisporea]|uniref:thioredoxin-dependent peroxiredoxin n=1 Tax=Saccharothrix variisporea TaxID=543527 RepID=A0A495XN11_9PSEU|nr:peroxiredoxin-like family protein [Saccharothrix variisporea]RKT75019.1 peroxiredoxin [Saccharothrix variisporea]
MSVNAELRAFYDSRQQQIPADVRAVMQRAARELEEADLRPLAEGATAPSFVLPSATGDLVSSEDLLADGPLVLTFYRGSWCPYCNIALRSLAHHHDAITTRGARLAAVSPQVPDESLTFAEKNELPFAVLSDVGLATAKAFGLTFDLPDDLAAVYENLGIDLHRANGGHARTLPIPATYVITGDHTIHWSFADTDYTRRAEPTDILAALDRLA